MKINKEKALFELFDQLAITTSTVRHKALHSVSETAEIERDLEGAHCKNLFLKDKKGHFLLVVMMGARRMDMKALWKTDLLPTGRLSFAHADYLMDMLGVTPGSVTPFALINFQGHEKQDKFTLVLDKEMLSHDVLNYHPLHNEATTSIKRDDFLKFINHLGHEAVEIDFDKL